MEWQVFWSENGEIVLRSRPENRRRGAMWDNDFFSNPMSAAQTAWLWASRRTHMPETKEPRPVFIAMKESAQDLIDAICTGCDGSGDKWDPDGILTCSSCCGDGLTSIGWGHKVMPDGRHQISKEVSR